MKATLSQSDIMGSALWEGEVLSASWDSNRGEFVIMGNNDHKALGEVLTRMVEKHGLTIEITDTGPGLLVWRGYLGSAKFQVSESEQVECRLIMLLDDWFGVFPRSTIPTLIDLAASTRLYPPLLPL